LSRHTEKRAAVHSPTEQPPLTSSLSDRRESAPKSYDTTYTLRVRRRLLKICPRFKKCAASQTKLAKPHKNFVSSIGAVELIQHRKIIESSGTEWLSHFCLFLFDFLHSYLLPKLLRCNPCPFGHRFELFPGNLWVNIRQASEGRKAAVCSGDHILSSNDFSKPTDPLGD
jgi:hypothetical protein